jgi:nicotinamide riboside transporter PnuC
MIIITGLSLFGVVLNIYKRKECFLVWMVTNFVWMIYDWQMGAKEQALLFFIYFIFAIFGFIEWQKSR